MKYVVLLLFPAFSLHGLVRVWPESLPDASALRPLPGAQPPARISPSEHIDNFLTSFRQNVPSNFGDQGTSERILHYSDAIQRPLCEAPASPEQVLAVCNNQFLSLLEDFNQLQPLISQKKLRKDLGLITIHLESLLEATQKREKLVEIAASTTERQQINAWFLREALTLSEKSTHRASAAFRTIGKGAVDFLSQNDFGIARNSPSFIIQVRLLQAIRFLRKVLQAYHLSILGISKTLGASGTRFERRLYEFFRNKGDKQILKAGALTLGLTFLAKKKAPELKVIKHLDKEFKERKIFIGKMMNQNSSLFETLRRMRNCAHKVEWMTNSIKGKLQTELEYA
jgi:hypothetical protein